MVRVSKHMKKNKLAIIGILVGLPVIVLVGLFYLDTMRSFLIAEDSSTPTDEPWSIVVVAGQSNAEGTNSFISDMPEGQKLGQHPADDSENPDDNALLWWEGADGGSIQDDPSYFWQALSNPNFNPAGWIKSNNIENPSMGGLINFKDLDKNVPMGQRRHQFGPEIGIARNLYDKGRRKIIVLKVTYGFQALGKSTSQFVPYDWNIDCSGNRSNKSYCHLLSAYSDLTTYLKNRNEKYTVDGLFWLQGETDTLDTGWTNAYEQNFDDLVNATKRDLKFHPQAHFVTRKFNMGHCIDRAYPATGDFCGFAYALKMEGVGASTILDALTINPLLSIPLNSDRIRIVRDAMQKAADKYNWVDTVETDDLPFYGDHIHMNASSQLIAGKRMSNMYELSYQPKRSDSIIKKNDYDGDGKVNSAEDVGRGPGCQLSYNAANNGNLGDDDSDCDGFPDYLDATSTAGSGLTVN